MTRVQEALIITILGAILAAGASTWLLTNILEERIANMELRIQDKMQSDSEKTEAILAENARRNENMEKQIDMLFKDLYVPKHQQITIDPRR